MCATATLEVTARKKLSRMAIGHDDSRVLMNKTTPARVQIEIDSIRQVIVNNKELQSTIDNI